MDKVFTMDDLEEEINGKSKKSPGINFNKAKISAEKLLGMEDENTLPIINPILQSGGIMQIFGERGVGKTYFTAAIAYALATGGNFLKFKVPVPQKIAYLDGEMGHLKFKPYLMQAMNNEGKSYFPENFDIISSSCFDDGEFPPLETCVQSIYNFLTTNGYNGVIIDNIATCTDIDENDPRAWKPLQKLFIRLRNAGLWVIFVAHAGLDKSRARGITHREDILNTVVCLQKSEEIIEGAKKIKITFTKDRDFNEPLNPFNAIHHRVDGRWEVEEITTSTYEQVIHWFLCGASGVKIAEKMGISPQMVSKYKQRGTIEGQLRLGSNGRVINLI